MKILFDNGTPKPIARSLTGLLSIDKNIRYQQNLSHRKTALVVLTEQQWPHVRLHLDRIGKAVAATPGSYVEVAVPYPSAEQR